MKGLFGRHRVRATFYHTVSLIFVISTGLWYFDILSDKMSYILTAILFAIDYLAEMYDPHPENPGPWFRSHFHRFFDGGKADEENEDKLEEFYNKIRNSDEFDHIFGKKKN